ncbi:MAG TPA: response regulator transcription factor [Balneolaceae bacterium]|nr:response regulator transcription factor [Balneolaceae bacterium]
MIRVTIADDHPLMREGIKKVLNDEIDMNVVSEAGVEDDIMRILKETPSEVLILDITMKGRSWTHLVRDISSSYPYLGVLIFSTYPEEKYAVRVLKAGAKGYVCKSSTPEMLVAAVRKIAVEKRRFITPEVAEQLVCQLNKKNHNQHDHLSDREFEIMCLIASGKNVHEIASELSLSFHTIHTYRSRIKDKMNFTSNVDIARYAIQNELVL